jgi:heme/copper-type cytochrome/quinol oxidase subunit 2
MRRVPSIGRLCLVATVLGGVACVSQSLLGSDDSPRPTDRVIEVIADHDSRFRVPGQNKPVITLTAGEEVRLRITAIKAKNQDQEGSVHGFTMLRAKDGARVPGWDFSLKPGVQEFTATAPKEPGKYVVLCTVICSPNHDLMNMNVMVLPADRDLKR